MIEPIWSRMQVEVLNRKAVAHPDRTGRRHVRVLRDLAQPTPPTQPAPLAVPERIRKPKQTVVA
jgi:hypothetical protein